MKANETQPKPSTAFEAALSEQIRALRVDVDELKARVDAQFAGSAAASIAEAIDQALAELSEAWGIEL